MTDITQLTMFRQKDVEKLFAGCVFVSPLEAVQMCGWLKPDMILDESIKRFWSKMLDAVNPDMNDDTVREIAMKIAMDTGVFLEVSGWMQDVTFSHLPLPYANEISRRHYLTQLSVKIGGLVQAINQSNDATAREIIRGLADMDVQAQFNLPVAFDVAERFDRVVTDGARSIPTFIPALDNAIGGLERQTLSVIAARPSVGKTALSWQIARSVAYNGKSVLFFSLEMSSVNLWGRAACPLINTTWRDVRAGKLSADQKERLLEESYKLAAQFDERLRIVDTPQTTETIWQVVAQMRPDLIVIDHLRLVKDQHISEVKRLGQISQRAKDLAKNFDCSVLLLAQLNRQSELRGKTDKRPVLADLRDSGEIEENADLVLMIHREEFEGNTKPEKSITEIWVRKFRDGPRDSLIKLLFSPKSEWFEELPR